MTRNQWAVVLTVVLLVAAGSAAASPRGSPDLSVYLPDDRVTPGDETTLGIVVLNGGDITIGGTSDEEARITTARDVRLRLSAGDAPVEVLTATKPVGNVPEGVTDPIEFTVSVDEDAAPGTYRLPVRIEYRWTNLIVSGDAPNHQESTRTVTEYVDLTIEPEASFSVTRATMGAFLDGTGRVSLTVVNVGGEAAHAARLTVNSDSPQLTFGGSSEASVFVGEWGAGDSRTMTFDGQLAAGADRRSYPLSVAVAFDDDGETVESDTVRTGVRPGTRMGRFAIVETAGDVAVGEDGTLTLSVRNVGTDPVSDARLAVESADPKLTFGDTESAETLVGEWGSGEIRTVSVKTAIADGADVRAYPLVVHVSYEDANGDDRESDPMVTGITPRPEQTFAVGDVSSTLAVGEEGSFEGRIVNTGGVPVKNAVVVFDAETETLSPVETEYAVGDLGPGEEAAFGFQIEVSESADAGPRQLSVSVRYRDANDDIRRSEPLDARVQVSPKRDAFDVEPVNATLRAGQSGTLTLRVTNVGDETLTDISAKLFADDPVSTADDEAFIDRLGPGESAEVVFGIATAGSALDKVYPVDVDFQYDNEDGDTLLSDTFQVPIRVTTGERGGLPAWAIGGVAAVAIAGIGGFALYRRRRE